MCQGLGIGVNGSAINNGGCAMDSLYTFNKDTVVSRLNRWGRWKMESGVALGFPSMAAFMRLGGGGSPGDHYDEFDSECIETNRAVDLLPAIPMFVIRIEYVIAYKDTAVKAQACGISKRAYYNYLQSAHEMVASLLNKDLRIVHESDINVLSVLEVRTA